MNLIVSLGNCGVIHGDFNEFNIMITEDAKPILIDFPQMVSTSHLNAKMYFDRDVACVRQLFKKKFGYESTEYPTFESLIREDDIDVEVACSGFGITKGMVDDLLQVMTKLKTTQLTSNIFINFNFCYSLAQEYGMQENSSDDETDSEDDQQNKTDESTNYSEKELTEFRKQVEDEIEKAANKAPKKFDPIQNYIQSVSTELGNINLSPADTTHDDTFEDAIDIPPPSPSHPFTLPQVTMKSDDDEEGASISSNDLQDENDDLADLDPNSRAYRFKMVEKVLSDARSHRSFSTTASTIAPSVIKDRIKKNIDLKEQREVRKRCIAKGEANAVTRGRKENTSTVKEYAGWDF